MIPVRRGFTFIEAVVSAAVLAVLLVLLLPAGARARQASGLAVSLDNVRRIIEAHWDFRNDNADQVPMRGARYTGGQMSGWDSWVSGGKNPRVEWTGPIGGLFDESAFSRPLNRYLYPDVGIPQPPGYLNVGSGPTWNFNHGTALPPDRTNLQLPVFRSPGDTVTYQGTVGSIPYGQPNPLLSCYNDVGTSYLLNMKWWDQPQFAGLAFTQRYNAGVAAIRALTSTPAVETYVWIHDQTADRVYYQGLPVQGEFGGTNRSVCGFLDGRAEYVEIVGVQPSGPGYTFHVPPPPQAPPGGGGEPGVQRRPGESPAWRTTPEATSPGPRR